MELWNDLVTEKSKELLFQLKETTNFVLIGGWAVWLYSQALKSKDIDIYINFDDFFKMQNFFINKGLSINLNPKLDKYEVKVEDIDIDIYTPHHCNLIIPCKDVFEKRSIKSIEGFKVVIPEALLIMKIEAEEKRHGTIKGFKDRIDILSLLYKANINKALLKNLAKIYNLDLRKLIEIIKQSSKEYAYLSQELEDLRKLKKLKIELIKKYRF